MHDKKFLEVYNEALEVPDAKDSKPVRDLDISWRVHIVTWAANQAINLDGDFVECGVWYGFLSKTICDYVEIDKTKKTFYLVDTWGDPTNIDTNHKNFKDDIYDFVKERFDRYHNVRLVRGLVPDILKDLPIKKIAYLSLDMNSFLAERATLEMYYKMMVPGGVMYFDDYGWDIPKLRETIDDFFNDKPETLLHFPSGNSLVIKI